MINLVQRALEIVHSNPELAVPLYDVLIFMASPGAANTSEFDEAAERLYAMTPDSRKHRELYEKSRAA